MSLILDRSHCRIRNRHQDQSRFPYPFQENAFKAMDKLKAENPNGFASVLVLPTGAGKTYTAAHWILENYLDKGTKVLWIAHRSELLRQAAEAFFEDTTQKTLPNRTGFESFVISSEFGRCYDVGQADIAIASRQSLISGSNMEYILKWAKGSGLKANSELLLVIDEAHHAAAKSYRTIINAMKKYIPHVDILGLTATPYRTAKTQEGSLKKIFNTGTGIVYKIDMDYLIKIGILADPNNTEVRTAIDMTKVFNVEDIKKIARTDLTSLDEKTIAKLTENAGRNKLIVDTYVKNKDKYGQTLVFAIDISNAIALNALFIAAGVQSDFVVSSLVDGRGYKATEDHNKKAIDDFKKRKLNVLINVNIITEGTDIPNIQTVFLARPTTSKILMTQMIGRGLRGVPAGGTKYVELVYFVDEWRGLIDFVSPKELLDGEDSVPLAKMERKKQIMRYMKIADIENYVLNLNNNITATKAIFDNIIPYGIIPCSYLGEDEYGNEIEQSKDILVFDEAAEIYKKILNDIPNVISKDLPEKEIKRASLTIFFKYFDNGPEKYIGVTSDSIAAIISSYITSGEVPKTMKIQGRVSLFDIARAIYEDNPKLSEKDLSQKIREEWDKNAQISTWYDYDFYQGMTKVYWNRLNKKPELKTKGAVPQTQKERMILFDIKKYYPAYYKELRDYVISNVKRDDEGYYYSDIQIPGKPRFRSKHLYHFEIDHIEPYADGGLSVKENLRLISVKENRERVSKEKNKKETNE